MLLFVAKRRLTKKDRVLATKIQLEQDNYKRKARIVCPNNEIYKGVTVYKLKKPMQNIGFQVIFI